MKKIMFNDKYGLTCAVLEGSKTMTRRAVTRKQLECIRQYSHGDEEEFRYRMIANAPYKVGDIVAIAQRYKDVALHVYNKKLVRLYKEDGTEPETLDMIDTLLYLQSLKGFDNKMYVKAEWMPHHIKITDIKVEAMAGISDEDCLKEGIYYDKEGGQSIGYPFAVPFYYTFDGAIGKNGKQLHWSTQHEAFKELIDRLNKRGFFESNPIVYAYTYELID